MLVNLLMDQSEESLQQQYIAGSAGQIANNPPPLHNTPGAIAFSSNVCIPVSSTMQTPSRLPVSTTQHHLADQEAEDQDLVRVRERLRLFWAKQMEEMKPADLKNHSLPLAPIKRIMKADKDVRMVAKESAAVLSKACEMFILDLTSRAWINTEEDARRIVQNNDIAAAIYKTDIFDFLEDVIPGDELTEQILKAKNTRQHVGSSTEPIIPIYNIPQQHGVGISSMTSAGGEEPPPFMHVYHPGPQNQQSFMTAPQAQSPLALEEPLMPWSQVEQLLDQPPMSRPHAKQTPEQPSPQADQ